ncbi:PPOX class F420-dependent oxidoreductase [Haloarculaceae archaeon H-GB2-1]|nr:PPOX class F420-dependent oxidoreductase [Haloarculaceae archaeon H-GB1-1]MEA5389049.1 PPOX class F420-dependent oxidoreductase [Haloarculaceae archaeon H-GB11]MEA5407109.1 PPOX class F420-dependent oxidoreductase [Haloarculaceae archaeon H-GB2-1]
MPTIPDDYRDLFERETFAHFATTLPDGTSHVSPVWVDYDGEYVLVAVQRNSRKHKNIQGEPTVAFSITDPDNPYRFVSVRGAVAEQTDDDAEVGPYLDAQSRQYWGTDYPHELDHVLLKIRPKNVVTQEFEIPDPDD